MAGESESNNSFSLGVAFYFDAMNLDEATSRLHGFCDLHRQFSSDSDTEEDIQRRIDTSTRVYNLVKEREERREMIIKEGPHERLQRLKREAKGKPHFRAIAYKIAEMENLQRQQLYPFSDISNLDIDENGNIIFLSNKFIPEVNGSLWCFRDVKRENILPNFVSALKNLHPHVSKYQIDAPFHGTISRNDVAVGHTQSSFTVACHTKEKHVIAYANGNQVGLARFTFFDQMKADNKVPEKRIKMAEEINMGLFTKITSDNHLSIGKPQGKVIALSGFFNDNRVVTGCEKKCFVVWDCSLFCRSGFLVTRTAGRLTALSSLPEVYDGFTVADNFGNVNIFDLRSKDAMVNEFKIYNEHITSLAVLPILRSNYIFGGSSCGKVHLFDRRMFCKSLEAKDINTQAIKYINFNSNGVHYAASTESVLNIFAWESKTSKLTDPVYTYRTENSISSVKLFQEFCYVTERPGQITKHDYIYPLKMSQKES